MEKMYGILKNKMTAKELQTLKDLDNKKNGTFMSLIYKSFPTQISAAYKNHSVMKITVASNLRKGVDPKTTKAYKLTHSVNSEPSKPSWQVKVRKGDPMLVTNKASSKFYIEVDASMIKSKTTWYFDGKEVTKEWLQENGVMQPSYWNRANIPTTLCITLSNIIMVK